VFFEQPTETATLMAIKPIVIHITIF